MAEAPGAGLLRVAQGTALTGTGQAAGCRSCYGSAGRGGRKGSCCPQLAGTKARGSHAQGWFQFCVVIWGYDLA
jgi:hypothetical protein